MTSQIRKLIELADILALNLKCKSCGSSLAIPASRDMTTREEMGKLASCPVCRRAWANLNGSTYEPAIYEFTGALNKLRSIITTAPLGFEMTLQISDEEEV
jgi:hypothetical protein